MRASRATLFASSSDILLFAGVRPRRRVGLASHASSPRPRDRLRLVEHALRSSGRPAWTSGEPATRPTGAPGGRVELGEPRGLRGRLVLAMRGAHARGVSTIEGAALMTKRESIAHVCSHRSNLEEPYPTFSNSKERQDFGRDLDCLRDRPCVCQFDSLVSHREGSGSFLAVGLM